MKKISQLVSAVIALAVFAVGCATPTPYQASSFAGGFSETQIAPDTFRIHFEGNGRTSLQQAQDFCSLRAAEVSIQNGFAYFVEVERKDENEILVEGSLIRPRSRIVIKCSKSKIDTGLVMDAAFVQQSIRAKYNLTK